MRIYNSKHLFRFEFFTASGVVPSGGSKKSQSALSIMQIIFYFWFFEVCGKILIFLMFC